MACIEIEQANDISIIHISGKLTFKEIIDTIKNNYHMVTCHLIWDFTNGDASQITPDQFSSVLATARQFRPPCEVGKTAYVSTIDSNFGMTRMFSVMAEISGMPYPYGFFHSFGEAVAWLHTPHNLGQVEGPTRWQKNPDPPKQ